MLGIFLLLFIVGHPDYELTGGSVVFKVENLLKMEPEEWSLAFSPICSDFRNNLPLCSCFQTIFLSVVVRAMVERCKIFFIFFC